MTIISFNLNMHSSTIILTSIPATVISSQRTPRKLQEGS
jgi:hypothetical protein